MTTSTPHWHIAQSNLRMAPYLAGVAGAASIVLAFFVPFHPTFVSIAMALGALTFAIQWFGVRMRADLGFIGTLLTIFSWMAPRDRLLPRDMATADYALTGAQFLAAWALVFAVLHLVFRAKMRRDLYDRVA